MKVKLAKTQKLLLFVSGALLILIGTLLIRWDPARKVAKGTPR